MLYDAVCRPKHYNTNKYGIEVIEITEKMDFCVGNAVKYISRAGHKNDAVEDLRKAVWYLDRSLRNSRNEAKIKKSKLSPKEESFVNGSDISDGCKEALRTILLGYIAGKINYFSAIQAKEIIELEIEDIV